MIETIVFYLSTVILIISALLVVFSTRKNVSIVALAVVFLATATLWELQLEKVLAFVLLVLYLPVVLIVLYKIGKTTSIKPPDTSASINVNGSFSKTKVISTIIAFLILLTTEIIFITKITAASVFLNKLSETAVNINDTFIHNMQNIFAALTDNYIVLAVFGLLVINITIFSIWRITHHSSIVIKND